MGRGVVNRYVDGALMSAALTPPPSPAAGATQGMPAATPNPMAAQLQTSVAGLQQVIRILRSRPGVDQAKLEQGAAMMRQGLEMIAAAARPTATQGAAQGAAPGAPPA
jgi:hypothetical protein